MHLKLLFAICSGLNMLICIASSLQTFSPRSILYSNMTSRPEIFSPSLLLALSDGNPLPTNGYFSQILSNQPVDSPNQFPVMQTYNELFVHSLNKLFNKQLLVIWDSLMPMCHYSNDKWKDYSEHLWGEFLELYNYTYICFKNKFAFKFAALSQVIFCHYVRMLYKLYRE